MKHIFHLLLLGFSTLLLGSTLVACTEDSTDEPNTPTDSPYAMTVEILAPGATSVTLKVTTEGIERFAYLVSTDAEVEYNASQIFAQGREKNPDEDNTTNLTINGLSPQTNYSIFFAAATVDESWYDQIVKVDFTTGALEDEITIYDIDYRSFRVHVNWPESVQEGNVLKWAVTDAYMYNSANVSDADKLNLHDDFYHNYITESHTFTFDNKKENICLPDGKGGYNEDYTYYPAIVPNQPTYFFLGEFSYVEEDEIGYWITDEDGYEVYVDFTGGYHEPGYYNPLFDREAWNASRASLAGISPLAVEAVTDQSQYWTGYYACYTFKTKAPEKFDGDVAVDTSKLKLNGGLLTLIPTDNVELYLYGVMSVANYQSMISSLPDTDEATIQWYLTSEAALFSYGIGYEMGPAQVDLSSFVTWGDTTTEYVVAIVGMGNEEGTSQFFKTETFRLPPATKPAPVLEIMGIEKPAEEVALSGEQSPYEIWFNVKCVGGDADLVMYACNDTRSWESALNTYGDYETIVQYGGFFTSDDVAAINSAKGLNVRFDVLPESEYGMAVAGYSDEGLMGKAVYAECTSGAEALPEKIDSELFEALKGDWTLKTHVIYSVYDNKTLTYHWEQGIRQSKVTIGDVEMPEQISADLYQAFKENVNWSETKVDGVYKEICDYTELYNEKTRNQNRILCQGLNTYPVLYYLDYNELEYCSPYALFVGISGQRYSYYDAGWIFSDYGPKWFIEVKADGTLGVPFNSATMDPLFGLSGHHLVGLNSTADTSQWASLSYLPDENGNISTGYFPVEVSDDRNTITVKALEYKGHDFYPVVATWSGAQFEAKSYSVSELVLTRGWSDDTQAVIPIESTASTTAKGESAVIPGEAPRKQTPAHALTELQQRIPEGLHRVKADFPSTEEIAARKAELMKR